MLVRPMEQKSPAWTTAESKYSSVQPAGLQKLYVARQTTGAAEKVRRAAGVLR